MNVAALLHDSPSDDRGKRQQQREREQQQQQQQHQQQQQQQEHHHQQQQQQRQHHHQHPSHSSPPTDRQPSRDRPPPAGPTHAHSSSQPPRHVQRSPPPQLHRPPSPRHSYSDYGARLPPPSSFMQDHYDKQGPSPPRRPDMHPPQEMARHGPPIGFVHPGPPPPQSYGSSPRPSLPPPPPRAPSHHLAHHGQPPPNPSMMHRGHPAPSQQGPPSLPPPGPAMPYPPPPGMGPTLSSQNHRSPPGPAQRSEPSPRFNEPLPPYGDRGRRPPQPPPHSQGQGHSPAMGSLPRPPPFDRDVRERERGGGGGPRGPHGPSQFGVLASPATGLGPAKVGAATASGMNVNSGRPPPMGIPSFVGPGPGGLGGKERDRDRERERDRDREREREQREREREQLRERERYQRERDAADRERPMNELRNYEREREFARQREREEALRQGEGGPGPIGMSEMDERERHWLMQQRQHLAAEPVWSRFAPPRMGDDERQGERYAPRDIHPREREVERMRERERERARAREQEREEREGARERRDGVREIEGPREREREQGWETEKAERSVRPTGRARQAEAAKEREREKAGEGMDGREQQNAMPWGKDQDRVQREREEMDAGRPGPPRTGQPPAPHHHHVLPHRHHVAGASSSSFPGSSMNVRPPNKTGPGSGSSVSMEGQQPGMPPQHQPQGIQRQGSTKMPGPSANPAQNQPTPHQAMQQRLHESHLNMVAHGHPLPLGPPGFAPPQFAAPPGALIYEHSRPPSPHHPPAPTLPPIHLGTFVWPRSPFPFLDFPLPTREVLTTILLPSAALLASRPHTIRLWGGAVLPTRTRVYTDDSDIFLCAIHAGWITWNDARREKGAGRDLRLELRLTKEARFMGGFGARMEGAPEDDGSTLLSAGWGNGHDGAGVQILSAKFIPPGTARSVGLRNRTQRMSEYAERRAELGCCPPTKRRRALSPLPSSENEERIRLERARADAELSATRIMTFGSGASWPEIWFKYHPDTLRNILFPQARAGAGSLVDTSAPGRSAKRRKLDSPSAKSRAGTPSASTHPAEDVDFSPQRAVVIETLCESFLISRRSDAAADTAEKENITDKAAEPSRGRAQRYTVALLPGVGGAAGKPAKLKDASTGVVASAAGPNKLSDVAKDESSKSDAAQTANPTIVLDPAAVSAAQELTSASSSTSNVSIGARISTRSAPPSFSLPPDSADSSERTEGALQVLHRDIGEGNIQFVEDGINVLGDDVVNGMRKGWKMEAMRWRWVQVDVASG